MAKHMRGRSHHSGGSSTIWIVLGCFGLFVLLLAVCFSFRDRSRGYLTQEEIDDLRVQKEERRERRIKAKMKRLEGRLRGSRMRKAVAEGAQESARLLEKEKEKWDEKGEAVYGPAWTESIDGNLPMKDLFELPEGELREIRIQAFNRVKLEQRGVEQSEREEREESKRREDSAVNTARLLASGQLSGRDPAIAFMSTRRSHRPDIEAPFHDPRFVSRSATNQQTAPIDAGFKSRPGIAAPPPRPPLAPMAPPPPPPAEVQLPGLSNPRPPSFDPPALPQVDIQMTGLTKPRPPSTEPPDLLDFRSRPAPESKYLAPPESEEEVEVLIKKKSSGKSTFGSLFDKMNKGQSIVGIDEIPESP